MSRSALLDAVASGDRAALRQAVGLCVGRRDCAELLSKVAEALERGGAEPREAWARMMSAFISAVQDAMGIELVKRELGAVEVRS